MSIKNPLTPAEIEPAIFRFVAQNLNHCATAVPFHHVCWTHSEARTGTNSLFVTQILIALHLYVASRISRSQTDVLAINARFCCATLVSGLKATVEH
jgi:hypothetical protein